MVKISFLIISPKGFKRRIRLSVEAIETITAGNYTVHGLRSSFRQWAAETTQYPEHVLEKALGHSSGSQLIDAYQRSDLFEQRRNVMQDWANYCLGE